ncbi:MAG: BMC domain-containing protein [Planctomycetes bacterium]|nr:BMC domain-containing protein [Planctomycetota bacterium]
MDHAERLGHRTQPDQAEPALGLIECSSIARGVHTADAVAKVSPVRLLWARTVTPGHYVVLFAGEVEEVAASFERGLEVAGDAVVDAMQIPNVHRDLVAAIRGPRRVEVTEAVGVVECRSVPTTVLAADAAVKAAAVDLIEVRLAMHLGGKGFFLVAGETGDVEEAVATGADLARRRGALVSDVVIPRASQELLEHLL